MRLGALQYPGTVWVGPDTLVICLYLFVGPTHVGQVITLVGSYSVNSVIRMGPSSCDFESKAVLEEVHMRLVSGFWSREESSRPWLLNIFSSVAFVVVLAPSVVASAKHGRPCVI